MPYTNTMTSMQQKMRKQNLSQRKAAGPSPGRPGPLQGGQMVQRPGPQPQQYPAAGGGLQGGQSLLRPTVGLDQLPTNYGQPGISGQRDPQTGQGIPIGGPNFQGNQMQPQGPQKINYQQGGTGDQGFYANTPSYGPQGPGGPVNAATGGGAQQVPSLPSNPGMGGGRPPNVLETHGGGLGGAMQGGDFGGQSGFSNLGMVGAQNPSWQGGGEQNSLTSGTKQQEWARRAAGGANVGTNASLPPGQFIGQGGQAMQWQNGQAMFAMPQHTQTPGQAAAVNAALPETSSTITQGMPTYGGSPNPGRNDMQGVTGFRPGQGPIRGPAPVARGPQGTPTTTVPPIPAAAAAAPTAAPVRPSGYQSNPNGTAPRQQQSPLQRLIAGANAVGPANAARATQRTAHLQNNPTAPVGPVNSGVVPGSQAAQMLSRSASAPGPAGSATAARSPANFAQMTNADVYRGGSFMGQTGATGFSGGGFAQPANPMIRPGGYIGVNPGFRPGAPTPAGAGNQWNGNFGPGVGGQPAAAGQPVNYAWDQNPLTGMLNDAKAKLDAANAANEARYGEAKQGYQDRIAGGDARDAANRQGAQQGYEQRAGQIQGQYDQNLGQLMGQLGQRQQDLQQQGQQNVQNVQDRYQTLSDSLRGESRANQAGLEQRYADRERDVLGRGEEELGEARSSRERNLERTKTLGREDRKRIADQSAQERARSISRMISSGLGNSTVLGSMLSGVMDRENRANESLSESIDQRLLNTDAALTDRVLGAQRGLTGLAESLSGQGLQFAERGDDRAINLGQTFGREGASALNQGQQFNQAMGERVSGDVAQALERGGQFGAQLGSQLTGEGLSADERFAGRQAEGQDRRSGDLLSFIERRDDVGPNLQALMAAAQGLGQYGQGRAGAVVPWAPPNYPAASNQFYFPQAQGGGGGGGRPGGGGGGGNQGGGGGGNRPAPNPGFAGPGIPNLPGPGFGGAQDPNPGGGDGGGTGQGLIQPGFGIPGPAPGLPPGADIPVAIPRPGMPGIGGTPPVGAPGQAGVGNPPPGQQVDPVQQINEQILALQAQIQALPPKSIERQIAFDRLIQLQRQQQVLGAQ